MNPLHRFCARLLWRLAPREKPFTGTLDDRIAGLEPLLEEAAGKSVLDLGCSDGLIGYEFARHGAALVHGIDSNPFSIGFARRLFRHLPTESAFMEWDLARNPSSLSQPPLLEAYDVVLFMGLYHHLKGQMSPEPLDRLVHESLRKSRHWYAVRTPLLDEFDAAAREGPFVAEHDTPPLSPSNIGPLRIFRRTSDALDS